MADEPKIIPTRRSDGFVVGAGVIDQCPSLIIAFEDLSVVETEDRKIETRHTFCEAILMPLDKGRQLGEMLIEAADQLEARIDLADEAKDVSSK